MLLGGAYVDGAEDKESGDVDGTAVDDGPGDDAVGGTGASKDGMPGVVAAVVTARKGLTTVVGVVGGVGGAGLVPTGTDVAAVNGGFVTAGMEILDFVRREVPGAVGTDVVVAGWDDVAVVEPDVIGTGAVAVGAGAEDVVVAAIAVVAVAGTVVVVTGGAAAEGAPTDGTVAGSRRSLVGAGVVAEVAGNEVVVLGAGAEVEAAGTVIVLEGTEVVVLEAGAGVEAARAVVVRAGREVIVVGAGTDVEAAVAVVVVTEPLPVVAGTKGSDVGTVTDTAVA